MKQLWGIKKCECIDFANGIWEDVPNEVIINFIQQQQKE